MACRSGYRSSAGISMILQCYAPPMLRRSSAIGARDSGRVITMGYRLGIDIGGTFTDFALFDEAKGKMCIHKQLTTSDDPSRAVLEGCTHLLKRKGVDFADVDTIAHGTTLVTNAVIERRGAVTGMLVTEGFRDVLELGRRPRPKKTRPPVGKGKKKGSINKRPGPPK